MKKLIITLALVIVSVGCFSQITDEERGFINFITIEIANEVNGISDSHEMNEIPYYMTSINPGSIYDFEFIRIKIRSIINSYSDLSFQTSWTPYEVEDMSGYVILIKLTPDDKSIDPTTFMITYTGGIIMINLSLQNF